jgi:hypothetical protein
MLVTLFAEIFVERHMGGPSKGAVFGDPEP